MTQSPMGITVAADARVAYKPRWIFPFVETVIGLGDWVNVSVMLRGMKRRAESLRSA